jgi:hypothetical protein
MVDAKYGGDDKYNTKTGERKQERGFSDTASLQK